MTSNMQQQSDKALEEVRTFIVDRIKGIISHHFAVLVIKSSSNEEAKKALKGLEIMAGIFNGQTVKQSDSLDMNTEDWNLLQGYIDIINTLQKQYDK